jgi:hypothetical protein
VTEAEFEQRWWEALMLCTYGHPAGCSYGGLGEGYWLVRDGCPLAHCDLCDLCGAAPVTDFRGTAPHDELGWTLWKVMCCRSCADREYARHPGIWRRTDEAAEAARIAELLSGEWIET